MRFLYAMTPAFVFIIAGTAWGAAKLGNWWWCAVIVGYYALFFTIETRILCSHCPYYSEDGKVLHCLANHGLYKFFKYRPEPMNQFEKRLLQFGFVLFALVPLSNQVINVIIISLNRSSYSLGYYTVLLVLLGLFVVSIVVAFSILFLKICPNCVNFSCPFNKVAKEEVDEYLRRNPAMKQAWKDCGYTLDSE
ncbi:MAG: hypothetical protein ACTSRE_11075 [Promethearchaeota archaeon]